MKAMLLAAGRGERMRPLTDFLPKPLLDAGGQPLIAHHLDAFAAADFGAVCINLAYRGDLIRAALGDGSRWGMALHYLAEPTPSLDTGGGIFNALSHLGTAPFAVVNADVWCRFPFRRFHALAAWMTAQHAAAPDRAPLAHLILVPNPRQHPQGDFGLAARPAAPGSAPPFPVADDGVWGPVLPAASSAATLTFSGLSLLHPQLFANSSPGRFSLVPLLHAAIDQGRVTGERFHGDWRDIGTPQRLHQLRCDLA